MRFLRRSRPDDELHVEREGGPVDEAGTRDDAHDAATGGPPDEQDAMDAGAAEAVDAGPGAEDAELGGPSATEDTRSGGGADDEAAAALPVSADEADADDAADADEADEAERPSADGAGEAGPDIDGAGKADEALVAEQAAEAGEAGDAAPDADGAEAGPVVPEASLDPAPKSGPPGGMMRAPDAPPEPDTEGLAGLVSVTVRAAADRELPAVTPRDLVPVMADRSQLATTPAAGADAAAGVVGAPASRGERARRPHPTPEPAPTPRLDFGPTRGSDPLEGGRPTALRIASLHLRTGQHALARAQLEALAGRGRLDEEALLDLAEVRWRTGDLSGAGDAANALLARGGEPVLALVIAAEAVAAAGRPGEARRLSTRALELATSPLDPLFAGMPRALVWPMTPAPGGTAAAQTRRRSRRTGREGEGTPSTAAEAFAGGRAALARGDTGRAALLLGVAMRLEPGFAEDVLRAVAGRDDQPQLALVRGDALRLVGREADALQAFDRARGRSSEAAANPSSGGPGLFDDDPAISRDER